MTSSRAPGTSRTTAGPTILVGGRCLFGVLRSAGNAPLTATLDVFVDGLARGSASRTLRFDGDRVARFKVTVFDGGVVSALD